MGTNPGSPLSPATHLALKVMATGAHDINNHLTVGLGSVAEVLDMIDEDDPCRRRLMDAAEALVRAAHTTQGLLSYASEKGVRAGSASFDTMKEFRQS